MKLVLVMVQNGAAKVFGTYGDVEAMIQAAEQFFGRDMAEDLRGASEGRQIKHSTGAYMVNWQSLSGGNDE